MSNRQVVSNNSVLPVFRDRLVLPKPKECNICNDEHFTYGKSRYFKSCAEIFWHIKQVHSKYHAESYEKRLVKSELKKLKIISEKNQRGIL